MWAVLGYVATGFDEIERVVIVFFDPRGNGKDVGVKHNILRRKSDGLCQDLVGALADFQFTGPGISLTGVIKSHHHNSKSVLPNFACLLNENGFAFFQGN